MIIQWNCRAKWTLWKKDVNFIQGGNITCTGPTILELKDNLVHNISFQDHLMDPR